MGLSSEEQKVLKRLQKKAEEPDPPAVGRTVSVAIDLGDEKQIARAQRYGFLPADEQEEESEEESEEEEGDEAPKRRGYFGDN